MKIQSEESSSQLKYWHPGTECCDEVWEEVYRRFETPKQEMNKFIKRLQQFGIDRWDKNQKVVELFCGQGTGLHALE